MTLNSLLGSADEVWRFEALQKVPILFSLSEAQLWQLAGAMQTESIPKGTKVFRKGDVGDSFYIIKDGIFTCCDGGAHHEDLQLRPHCHHDHFVFPHFMAFVPYD